ncbi:hypothetical protein [Haloimpatiens massiliensis]|uniref:hypothetical protein n=1 Tax=Haloimpatiens massiliensis TaxID=1658110 RepID=UPI000C852BD0|nr:hypothetical protein [Haloimpatiens massiliensis]
MDTDNKKTQEAIRSSTIASVQENTNIGAKLLDSDYKAFKKLDRDHLQGSAKQKHGGAGEILAEKNYNAEQIKNKSGNRMKMSESGIDPVSDLIICDANDNVISRGQVKYCKDAKSTMEALSEKSEYNKNDVKYVPKGQGEEVRRLAKESAQKAKEKAKTCKATGDVEGYKKNLQKAKNYEDTAKKATELGSREEAVKASENDMSRYKVMGKEAFKDANGQGMKSAKVSAGITGVVSGTQNIKAVIDGDKEIFEAIIDTSKDVAMSSAISYVTTAGGSLAKVGLDKTAEQITTKLGTNVVSKGVSQGMKTVSNNVAVAITCSIEAVKSFDKYFSGEISGQELVVELGEKGTGITASLIGSQIGGLIGGVAGGFVGTFVLPGGGTLSGASVGKFVGEAIGGMIGYLVGTQLYSATVKLLSYDKVAAEKRQRIMEFCDYCSMRLNAERKALDNLVNNYLLEKHDGFKKSFNMLDKAVIENDFDCIDEGLTRIARAFDSAFKFKTFDEFDEFMLDENTILKL